MSAADWLLSHRAGQLAYIVAETATGLLRGPARRRRQRQMLTRRVAALELKAELFLDCLAECVKEAGLPEECSPRRLVAVKDGDAS